MKLAHVRLCHSAFFLVAYPRESQEMVFDAHAGAFAFFGGVPHRGIYDNLKSVVDGIFTGKKRRWIASSPLSACDGRPGRVLNSIAVKP